MRPVVRRGLVTLAWFFGAVLSFALSSRIQTVPDGVGIGFRPGPLLLISVVCLVIAVLRGIGLLRRHGSENLL
jgi:hypothetical protein